MTFAFSRTPKLIHTPNDAARANPPHETAGVLFDEQPRLGKNIQIVDSGRDAISTKQSNHLSPIHHFANYCSILRICIRNIRGKILRGIWTDVAFIRLSAKDTEELGIEDTDGLCVSCERRRRGARNWMCERIYELNE